MSAPWMMLIVAGLLEVVWAVSLKLSRGLTHVGWTALTIVALIGSMGLLAYAMRSLPLGTAYAVWVGVGVAGTAVVGMTWLGEPPDTARLVFLGLLVVALVGLKLTTPAS